MRKTEAQEIAIRYAAENHIIVNLDSPLGSGNDGWVWRSERPSVIKVLERSSKFNIELECYQRLHRAGKLSIRGFSVPQLVNFNADLLVIEMTLVVRPYLIDFAKSYLDRPADYSPEVWEDWERKGRMIFGKRRWQIAKKVAYELQEYGIYYTDIQPGNLMFEDWTGEDEDESEIY